MKHHSRPLKQDDLLRPRLVDMIDLRHALVKLAALIDGGVRRRRARLVGVLSVRQGSTCDTAAPVARLLHLPHAYRLSDQAVIARLRLRARIFQNLTGEALVGKTVPRTVF